MLNESKSTETSSKDVRKTVEKLIELLIEEPDDFVSQLESLL
jgi:ribosomal protein L17